MIVAFSKEFKKEYRKLPKKIQKRVTDRIVVFSKNHNHPQLNNHKLHGKYTGYYSINLSGDLRAIYEPVGKKKVLFLKIGTHSKLYT